MSINILMKENHELFTGHSYHKRGSNNKHIKYAYHDKRRELKSMTDETCMWITKKLKEWAKDFWSILSGIRGTTKKNIQQMTVQHKVSVRDIKAYLQCTMQEAIIIFKNVVAGYHKQNEFPEYAKISCQGDVIYVTSPICTII